MIQEDVSDKEKAVGLSFEADGLSGSPNENRTRDSALRGRRLHRLTMEPYSRKSYYTVSEYVCPMVFALFSLHTVRK